MVEIKKLTPSDVDAAGEMFVFFQIGDGVDDPSEASTGYLQKLLARDDFHVIAAFDDGKMVGGLTAYELPKYKNEAAEMFLYEIGVDDGYQRRGIASRMIGLLKTICAEKEIAELFVLTETDNGPARRLYEKTGGEPMETVMYEYDVSKNG